MKRYFLISIIRNDKSGNVGHSDIDAVTNGGYINRYDFIENLHSKHGFTNVVILNIIELNQEDFEFFKLKP